MPAQTASNSVQCQGMLSKTAQNKYDVAYNGTQNSDICVCNVHLEIYLGIWLMQLHKPCHSSVLQRQLYDTTHTHKHTHRVKHVGWCISCIPNVHTKSALALATAYKWHICYCQINISESEVLGTYQVIQPYLRSASCGCKGCLLKQSAQDLQRLCP